MNRFYFCITLLLLCNLAAAAKPKVIIDGPVLQGSLLRGQVEPGSTVLIDGSPVAVSSTGRFVFGFSRDDTEEKELVVSLQEHTYSVILKPQQRDYRIQRIDGLEQNKVTPPHEVLARIRNDAVLVRNARSNLDTTLTGYQQTFIWPAKGPISGIYGSQRVLNGKPSRPHFGVDVAAPKGADVVAPAKGKVTLAHADLYYSGGTIIVDHGMGVFSTFLHLSQLSVSEGQYVEQGQNIGKVGSTGRATGPHLDWRINWLTMRLDPALLVTPREGLDYVHAE